MKIAILLISVTAVLVGCFGATPNLIFANTRGIKAKGTISGKLEKIRFIEINPRELSEIQIHDLWVGLSATNKTLFSEITESNIESIGILSTNYYSTSTANPTYFAFGYSFCFDRGQFISFLANQYGFPPKKVTAFVRLGSLKNQSELSLPCTIEDFEKVFGKANNITRGFSW